MYIMVAGLVLFLGIHLLPAVPPLRTAVANALGERPYKAMFSIVSAVGLVLIVVGYANSGAREPLFAPLPWAKVIAPFAICVAFVLLAAANMRGYLRKWLQHPMLIGILIWSGIHLLANGDRTGTVLFGAVLAYAVLDLVSAIARRAVKSFEPEIRFDAMAVSGGLVVAFVIMTFHRMLFGVPVVAFSV